VRLVDIRNHNPLTLSFQMDGEPTIFTLKVTTLDIETAAEVI